MMTYEEVIEFAKQHYNEGGDCIYECLDRKDYEREVADGRKFTKTALLKEFKIAESIRREYEAMANW